MKKGILRKAVSLVLALSLVIALMPTMFASAASGNDKEFSFSKTTCMYGTASTDEVTGDYAMSGNYVLVDSLNNYVDGTNTRDWKYFTDNVINGGKDITPLAASLGVYFDGNAQNKLVAFKLRGLESGTYDVKLWNNVGNKKGCVCALYVLNDDLYGNATAEQISEAIESNAAGVQKVGEVDNYQNTTQKLDYGTAEIRKSQSGDVIVVVQGTKLSEATQTTDNNSKSTYFISLEGISFTYTGELPAQNKETFGDTAAFFEKTENNECNVYLVSAIESLSYSKAGFKVAMGEENAEEINTTTVYEKLTVDGVDYTAENFGLDDGFLYVVKKTLESFAGQTIDFKPFAVNSTGEIAGSTYQATLKSN